MNKLLLSAALLGPTLLAGCGDDQRVGAPVTLTLVAYDSFPTKDSPLIDALASFTTDTNIAVRVVTAGDTGTMVNKAKLTAGNPEGDVIWGVDNTWLSAAVDGKIFDGQPTLVDRGDVCVNYDRAWFTVRGIDPPQTLDDLRSPAFKDLLVVQNPSTSSPGLAFLMATIAAKGEPGWQDYWTALRANGVKVVDSWDTAYYEEFSGSGGGTRPLVVSYGTSPPAEVVFSDPPRRDAVTGVATETCFHQEEYAGVLRGTPQASAARKLVSFMTSERFQAELPLALFVYPVNPRVTLPKVFTDFGYKAIRAYAIDPAEIAANRERWQDQWNQIVLR